MEGLQIIVGVFLVALGGADVSQDPPAHRVRGESRRAALSQAHRDRISGIVFAFHLIAGFTSLSGLAVILLAAA
ncbi:MAG: hypothetical protein ACXW15_10300 [Acidimicrobiia bacterium]